MNMSFTKKWYYFCVFTLFYINFNCEYIDVDKLTGVINVTLITLNNSTDKNENCKENKIVLWNTLDSKYDVEHSKIGPDGIFYGGSFIKGKYGNAFKGDYVNDSLIVFPSDPINPQEGCIEFWAKLTGVKDVIPWGPTPCLLTCDNVYDDQSFIIHFNGNDGEGNGGICARAGNQVHTGTGFWYNDYKYEDILGDQVQEWHHYALVWNEKGIKSIGKVDVTDKNDNIEKKLCRAAIYIDGKLKSGRWKECNGSFYRSNGSKIRLILSYERLNPDKYQVMIDNLKIWQHEKTDFSDRFTE